MEILYKFYEHKEKKDNLEEMFWLGHMFGRQSHEVKKIVVRMPNEGDPLDTVVIFGEFLDANLHT